MSNDWKTYYIPKNTWNGDNKQCKVLKKNEAMLIDRVIVCPIVQHRTLPWFVCFYIFFNLLFCPAQQSEQKSTL